MDVSIHINGLKKTRPQPLREGDSCIMDVILSLLNVSNSQLRTFDRCHIHLGVFQVSEISSADGTSFSRDAWEGARPRISPLLWPYQPPPGPKSFRMWRQLLATAFLTGHRASVSRRTRDLRLRRPMRRWLPASDHFRYHWRAFFSNSQPRLFLLPADATTFGSHLPRKTRRRPKHPLRVFSAEPSTSATTLPGNTAPVDHSYEPNKIVIPLNVPRLPLPPWNHLHPRQLGLRTSPPYQHGNKRY
jgi:hypothetical protein